MAPRQPIRSASVKHTTESEIGTTGQHEFKAEAVTCGRNLWNGVDFFIHWLETASFGICEILLMGAISFLLLGRLKVHERYAYRHRHGSNHRRTKHFYTALHRVCSHHTSQTQSVTNSPIPRARRNVWMCRLLLVPVAATRCTTYHHHHNGFRQKRDRTEKLIIYPKYCIILRHNSRGPESWSHDSLPLRDVSRFHGNACNTRDVACWSTPRPYSNSRVRLSLDTSCQQCRSDAMFYILPARSYTRRTWREGSTVVRS
jgi:hypothetical protein